MKKNKKTILVAPLNWGLGHAARCIPIIRELELHGFIPIIASDGNALQLLKLEFPHLLHLELPSYCIEYAKNEKDFTWKLLKNSPKTMAAIFSEKKLVKKWCKEFGLSGIISDNRLGVYSKKIPSVIISHQINVLSGKTTWISSKLHQYFIKKFSECWVPDFEGELNFSGILGHPKNHFEILRYIGIQSRFTKKQVLKKYDLLVLLSGPEPQRSILEEKLEKEVQNYHGSVLFIKGIVEKEQKKVIKNHVTYVNYMTSAELEENINASELILCRSGYTTIMDLIRLEKKAFFIPTPGQYEQEYLAKNLKENNMIPSCKQDEFTIQKLKEVALYDGFPKTKFNTDWKQLFSLFERK